MVRFTAFLLEISNSDLDYIFSWSNDSFIRTSLSNHYILDKKMYMSKKINIFNILKMLKTFKKIYNYSLTLGAHSLV